MKQSVKRTFLEKLNRQRGISHVELMIAVALVMVVTATALPDVSKMRGHNKVMDARQQLLMDFNFAQNTAVRNYRRIVICPSDNQQTCNGGNSWQNGWIIFQDFDANNQRNGGESVLKFSQLNANVTVTSGVDNHFHFYPDGSAPDSTGSLLMCIDGEPEMGHRVMVFDDGRVRSEDYSCS